MVRLFLIKQISLQIFLCFIVLCPGLAQADHRLIDLTGHLKFQSALTNYQKNDLLKQFGLSSTIENGLDARLNYSWQNRSFEFVLNTELLGFGGNAFDNQKQVSSIVVSQRNLLPNDKTRLFNLTTEVINGQDMNSIIRADRFYVGWNKDPLRIQLGRQAISWGNGLLFQVLDPFNPFSPIAIEKDYKPGDDLGFAQIRFPKGDDLQFLVIPRRDPISGDLENRQSSFAAKWHISMALQQLDLDLILARHFDEDLFGLGLSKTVSEAVLRSDVLVTKLENGEIDLSFLANMDYSWELFGKNFYGFAEVFHSAAGLEPEEYSTGEQIIANSVLSKRLSRGELFTLGQDYLGTGIRIEYSPGVNNFLNTIYNLHDQSGFLQTKFEFEWTQDLLILIGLNQPWGGGGSEFGGILLERQGGYLALGTTVFIRLTKFF